MTLMNMLKFAQFGCGPGENYPSKNILKKTPQGNHWGYIHFLPMLLKCCIISVNKLFNELMQLLKRKVI